MSNPVAFVLGAMMGGPMIVNRLDYQPKEDGKDELGVGLGMLQSGEHGLSLINLVADLAQFRRQTMGDGVAIIDGGANIGPYSVFWAKMMTDPDTGHSWGSVTAFEPQMWCFYALCGNLALNNCFNAAASMTALGKHNGTMQVPVHDPRIVRNAGGLSLLQPGRPADPVKTMPVPVVAIDNIGLRRLDILKLDVEGMEGHALAGAHDTIERLKPLVLAEWTICGKQAIQDRLPGYEFFILGMDLLAVHHRDPVLPKIKLVRAP